MCGGGQVAVVRVLLVDDFARMREFVRSMLSKSPDLEVVGEATDGLEALHLAKKLQPDLILLDVALPSLNGLGVARRVRALSPDSKIVIASVQYSPELVQEAIRSGAVGYVRKADMATHLLPAIEAVLQGKRFVLGMLADRGMGETRSPELPR
jgi:DNA-binding NarL/FixJ family response regulator